MGKCLKIDYISNYKNNHKIDKFVNERHDECLICYETLNSIDVVMENHFCDCYHIVLLCGKCFKKWYMNDTKCFICRKKYMTYNEKKKDNVFLIDKNIRLKYGLKCKGFNNMRFNPIQSHTSIVTPYVNQLRSDDSIDSIDVVLNIEFLQDINNIPNETTNQTDVTNTTNTTNRIDATNTDNLNDINDINDISDISDISDETSNTNILNCIICCRRIDDTLILFFTFISIGCLTFLISFSLVKYL